MDSAPTIHVVSGVELVAAAVNEQEANDHSQHQQTHQREQRDSLVNLGICTRCGHPDNLAHRILECADFAQVREGFTDTLNWVTEHAPHWILSPYITVHPDHCRWQTICATFSDFDLDIHIERLPDVCTCVIFVDGSSVTPSIPLQSFAAWATVVDRTTDDSARVVFADKYSFHHELPETLMHSFSGRVAGCQSNDRVELVAALRALQSAQRLRLVTDSTYTTHVVNCAIEKKNLMGFFRPNLTWFAVFMQRLVTGQLPRSA